MKTKRWPGIPDDIFLAIKRWCSTQRAILTNRDQIRRLRVIRA